MRTIRVFAPATIANVGPGFDVFGLALHEPGDEVVASVSDQPGVHIRTITGDGGKLPLDPTKNVAAVAAAHYLKHIHAQSGVELTVHKHMPLGSGLGSSAASSVAAVVAANELFGSPLRRQNLLPFTMEGERIACGAAHADNVAPSLLGGFVLIRSYNPLDVIQIPVPEFLHCTVVHPHIEVRTEDARKILRRELTLADSITQWGNTAGLIAGLMQQDAQIISRSLTDVIIEPQRSLLIPGFDAVKKAALDAGALGSSISGSGPSIFALSDSIQTAKACGEAMRNAFNSIGLESDVVVSKVNKFGPRILPVEE
ncbi:homoserine kinase [Candidatus Uhrbacteria bacterium]|nr:homoserine kinase [Candidatus Uhrbacteria bacterium]